MFVHFPIALFTFYAILEILPFEKKVGKGYFYIKLFLLTAGAVMSVPTYISGSVAGEGIENGPMGLVVAYHAFFAGGAIVSACVLGVLYLIRLRQEYPETVVGKILLRYVPDFVPRVLRLLLSRGFMVFGATLVLFFVTITGALGGSLVYGPDADPLIRLVYKVLNLS